MQHAATLHHVGHPPGKPVQGHHGGPSALSELAQEQDSMHSRLAPRCHGQQQTRWKILEMTAHGTGLMLTCEEFKQGDAQCPYVHLLIGADDAGGWDQP